MKHIYIVVLFCIAQLHAYSQYSITVLDNETKEPVPYANVYFPDTKTGTATNESGRFVMNTKLNAVLVQITSINYKTFLETIQLPETQTIYMEPSYHSLQEVTISGDNSKLQGENVLNVESIGLENSLLMPGISLSQKIANVAGVSNYSTGTGIGKPMIRGLTGNRVAVFSQGIRLENQQWGVEHGLGLDENGYEQLEVIKGPSSLLYGSDALGGVLYFVGERYAKDNTVEAALNSEYDTNTDGWRNTAAFKLSKGKFHWNLFGGYTTHRDYKGGNDDAVDNSRFNTADIKTALGYTIGRFNTSLRYSYLNEKYGLLNIENDHDHDEEDGHNNARKPMLPYQNLTTHLVSSENTYFFRNESKLKFDLGYILNKRQEFEDHSHHDHEGHNHDHGDEAALEMNLNTFSYNAKWISPQIDRRWLWIAGSQGMYQYNKNEGEEILIPDATTMDAGVYITTDYYYTKKSYWQVGLRFDVRNIDGEEALDEDEEIFIPSFSKTYSAFNFSTGIYQQLGGYFSLRTSLSSGYRAPNMFELLSNGIHEGANRYEISNQHLDAENSYQVDLLLNFKTEHIDIFVNPYFNYIRNYIYLRPTDEVREDLPVYYYDQTYAYLLGGEAGFHFHPHPWDWLHIEAAYSSTFGQDNDKTDLPLMPSPKINAIANANFTFDKEFVQTFSVFMQYQYSFRQDRIAEYETPTSDYSLVNTGLRVGFKYLSLEATVNNVFNKTYVDHLSRYKADGIYNIGRNFVFKLTVPLSIKL